MNIGDRVYCYISPGWEEQTGIDTADFKTGTIVGISPIMIKVHVDGTNRVVNVDRDFVAATESSLFRSIVCCHQEMLRSDIREWDSILDDYLESIEAD